MGVLPVRLQPLRFELPAGLATVFGALPSLVADRIPKLPGAELIIGLDLDRDLGGALDDADTSDDADDPAFEPIRSFLASIRGRIEPIVLSLNGPVTVDLALLDAGVDRADALAAAERIVLRRARRLIELAGGLAPNTPVMLFFSEPGLAHSMHPSFPLESAEIEEMLTDVVEPMGADAMVGVTVDGRADWAMLLRTGILVLGAPVTARLETAATEIARFLERGGFIAWGAVPTDEPLGLSTERLWKRLSALWCELVQLGNDPLLLRDRSIITSTTGLAGFGVSQAERVMGLAQDLADRVLTQTVGARLSIGA